MRRVAKAAAKKTVAKKAVETTAERTMKDISANSERLRRMEKIATRFEGWAPALDVLVPIRSVRSIFVQIDADTKVGGWPIDRVAVIHGPSNHGKTAFVHGLGLSFLKAGHYYAFVDAEYATPEAWLRTLMKGYEKSPTFRALRPSSYEQAVDAVRAFCTAIGEAKAKREIPEDTTGLFAVDSIGKLAPQKLLKTLLKEGAEGAKGSIDGMSGRGAMYKAALNSQWLNELIPLCAQTGTAGILITREIENPDAGPWDRDWKTTGGKNLIFDSSLTVRVVKAGNVTDGTGKDALFYGERHSVQIHKTRVGSKDEKTPTSYFYTSNGMLSDVPAGFDRGRDIFHMACEWGLIEKSGASYVFDCERIGVGEHDAVRRMYTTPELADRLEQELRSKFRLEGQPL